MNSAPVFITETDQSILRALSRYHYVTAAQASRLLYPRLSDKHRYMQRRLKKLVDGGLVLRLRALPTPHYGQSPHVFTLGSRGRKYLQNFGVSVHARFRRSEARKAAENNPFMYHRLAAVDVLILADGLCRDYDVFCPRLLSERDLRRSPVKVELGRGEGTRHVAVIPDGWFQLSVASSPAVSIALELDRSTEDQKAWRQKIAAYAAWAQGPYRDAFETDNLTVAVVTVTKTHRDRLRDWTLRELTKCSVPELADIFLFTASSPSSTPPFDFFFGNLWHLPHQERPVSLLDLPEPRPREVFYRTP
jgi:Replication-relaxation